MNKRIIAAAVLSAAIMPATMACTNLLVGKKASVNGSTMISYNADSHQLYGDLHYTPAADHQVGEMRQVIDWDSQRPLGQIPQPTHTYRVVGNQNEWQVTIDGKFVPFAMDNSGHYFGEPCNYGIAQGRNHKIVVYAVDLLGNETRVNFERNF